jgi:hypothetical protein
MKPRLLIFLVLLLTVYACGLGQQEASSQPTVPISTQSSSSVDILEAINASVAVEAQMPRLPGSDGSPLAPKLIDVILVSRSEAYPDALDIDDPERPMWIVRMVGEWADPLTVPAQEGFIYHNLEFIIDGVTGEMDTWKASQ